MGIGGLRGVRVWWAHELWWMVVVDGGGEQKGVVPDAEGRHGLGPEEDRKAKLEELRKKSRYAYLDKREEQQLRVRLLPLAFYPWYSSPRWHGGGCACGRRWKMRFGTRRCCLPVKH